MNVNYFLLGRIAIHFMKIPENTPKTTHDTYPAKPPA